MQPQNTTPTPQEPQPQENTEGNDTLNSYTDNQGNPLNEPRSITSQPNTPAVTSYDPDLNNNTPPASTPIQQPIVNPSSTYPTPVAGTESPNSHEGVLVPDKSHTIRNTLIAIIAVVILAGAGFAYWTYGGLGKTSPSHSSDQEEKTTSNTPQTETISVSDLAETQVANTTYQYPKTWYPISGPGITGYESTIQNTDGLQSRVVAKISEPTSDGISLAAASESDVARVRGQLIGSITKETAVSSLYEAGVRCTSDVTLQVIPDTSVSDTHIGMYYADMSCEQAGGEVVSRAHFILGKDGRNKALMILVSRSTLDKNKDVFDRMIDSIK